MLEIIELSKSFLKDPGPTRESACACLSSLLTRPDMENLLLSKFFTYSCDVITSWTEKGDDVITELTSNSFNVIGVLQTVAQIFKKGDRNKLLTYSSELLSKCLAISSQSNQVKIRKLTIKLIQRIGMTFLSPRVAVWRYQRGKRSLADNLTKSMGNGGHTGIPGNSENVGGEDEEKVKDKIQDEKNEKNENDENKDKDDGENFEVEPELDDVIDRILTSLSDKDTVVR